MKLVEELERHFSHDENLADDCPVCDEIMRQAYDEFYFGPVYTKAELEEMEADLPLMRNEFHR